MAAEAQRAVQPLIDHLPRYLGHVLDALAYSAWEPLTRFGAKAGRTKGYLATSSEVLDPNGWYIATSDLKLALRVRGYDLRSGETRVNTDVVAAARKALLALGIIIGGSLRLAVKTSPAGCWFAPTYELNLARIDLSDLGWLDAASTDIYALLRSAPAARVRAELPALVEQVPLAHFGSTEWRDLTVNHITNYSASDWLCWDGLVPTRTPQPIQQAVLRHIFKQGPFPAAIKPAPPQLGIPNRAEQPPLIDPDNDQETLFTAVPPPAATGPVSEEPPSAILNHLNAPAQPLEPDDPWLVEESPAPSAPSLGDHDPDDVPNLADAVDAEAMTAGERRRQVAETIATQDTLVDIKLPADTARRIKRRDERQAKMPMIDSIVAEYLAAADERYGLNFKGLPNQGLVARWRKQLRDLVCWVMVTYDTPVSDVSGLILNAVGSMIEPVLVPSQGQVAYYVETGGRPSATKVAEQRKRALAKGSDQSSARSDEEEAESRMLLMELMRENGHLAEDTDDSTAMESVHGWRVRPEDPPVRVGAR